MRNVLLPVIAAAIGLVTVSANAAVYTTVLSSLNQVPPQESNATGSATVRVFGNLLSADVIFANLKSGFEFGHIHCCDPPGANAPVAIPFVDFPQVTTGEYKHSFNLLDTSVYAAEFLKTNGGTAVSARDALITGLNAGLSYVNLHDAPAYPAGEIRGQLAPAAAVPEPAALVLFGLATLALVARHRRV